MISIVSALAPIEVLVDHEKLAAYSRDEATESAATPVAVVFPRSAEEVSKIFKFARAERIPVVPRGAGSGLSGAAVPDAPSIIVSLERMNRILEVDEENRMVVAEPGVITGEIRKAAEARGLFYPPIPASVDFCSIGGNIATNAGGLCAVKYGVTREYVLGLEVVLPTGEIIRTGGKFIKNSTGYNLTQLIVGSEGTLGIVTKIILKLLPAPRYRETLLASFPSIDSVTGAVLSILDERIIPPTLELLPQEAVKLVLSRHPNLDFPFKNDAASLLIELDGKDEASIEKELEALAAVLEKHQSNPPIVATSAAQRDEIWSVRKLVRDAIANSGDYEEADSVVPRNRVGELVHAAYESGRKFGLPVICYGHAGDGNMHTYFRRENTPEKEWASKSKAALEHFFIRTVELGGTISGEHGIGSLKKEYLPLALSPSEIDLMKRVKKAFDPDNILNPGKIFPDSK